MSGVLEALHIALGGGDSHAELVDSHRQADSRTQSPAEAAASAKEYSAPVPTNASPLLPPLEPIDVISPMDLTKTPTAPGDTSIVSLADTSMAVSSAFSSPAEILFGPQATPFVYRKRERANTNEAFGETPSKVAFLPGQHHRNISMPVIHSEPVSPENKENRPPPPPVISPNRHFSLLMSQIKATQIAKSKDTRRLSSWRIEQLGRLPTAKTLNETDAKPIPVLHGPLSLPYARNPSGVDAVVADETAYLSNVFGLRAAVDIRDAETRALETRIPSFGTSGTRSTSGSSSNYSADNVNTSVTTTSATSSKPLERDPHQHIGIKKANNDSASTEFKQVKISTMPVIAHGTHTIPARLLKSTSQTPSSILRAQIPGHVAQQPLATIPSSPMEIDQDPFQPLFESAIKTADVAHRQVSDGSSSSMHDSPGLYASQMIIKDLAQYLNAQFAGNQPPKLDLGEIMARVELAERLKTPAQGIRSSKADSSANWRNRGMSAGPPPSPSVAGEARKTSSSSATSEPPVMTIDALFEKFGRMSIKPAAQTKAESSLVAPQPTPSDPAIKQKSDKPITPAKATTPLGPTKRVPVPASPAVPQTKPKSSITGADIAKSPIKTSPAPEKPAKTASPAKGSSPSAAAATKAKPKGTPGAGKLLKKGKVGVSSPLAVSAASIPLPPASDTSSTA